MFASSQAAFLYTHLNYLSRSYVLLLNDRCISIENYKRDLRASRGNLSISRFGGHFMILPNVSTRGYYRLIQEHQCKPKRMKHMSSNDKSNLSIEIRAIQTNTPFFLIAKLMHTVVRVEKYYKSNLK